jgi:hypothetical protein
VSPNPRAVFALVDHDTLAGQLSGDVEQRHHPRQDEDRIAAGTKEGSRNPAVRVLGLAEGRDQALDAGQVLEIGRRRQEEEVHPRLRHPIREPPSALGVVEHDARV